MSDITGSISSTELLNILPSAVATYDYTTGDVLMLNHRFTEQYGYTLGDMPNIRLWWHQMFIDPETSEEIKEHWEALQKGHAEMAGPTDSVQKPLEVRGSVRCKDGEDRYVELRIVFMGRIIAIAFTDITREVLMAKELERAVTLDGQTGFRNKKAFTEVFSHQMERARRYHEPLAIILIRVAVLDKFEEEYGKEAAGRMMGFVGRQIMAAVRNCDLAGRTGSNEISILLPATPTLGVAVVAERIVKKIKATPFYYDGKEIIVETCMGVAASDDGIQTAVELQRIATDILETQGMNRK